MVATCPATATDDVSATCPDGWLDLLSPQRQSHNVDIQGTDPPRPVDIVDPWSMERSTPRLLFPWSFVQEATRLSTLPCFNNADHREFRAHTVNGASTT